MTWDALVLGVGGMGAAAPAHLAGRGLRVLGIERDDVPSLRGSSVGQTRTLRKAFFEDARQVPLLHRAYELWNELDPGLFLRTGCLDLGPAEHPTFAVCSRACAFTAWRTSDSTPTRRGGRRSGSSRTCEYLALLLAGFAVPGARDFAIPRPPRA